jgi:hypothetical protein
MAACSVGGGQDGRRGALHRRCRELAATSRATARARVRHPRRQCPAGSSALARCDPQVKALRGLVRARELDPGGEAPGSEFSRLPLAGGWTCGWQEALVKRSSSQAPTFTQPPVHRSLGALENVVREAQLRHEAESRRHRSSAWALWARRRGRSRLPIMPRWRRNEQLAREGDPGLSWIATRALPRQVRYSRK